MSGIGWPSIVRLGLVQSAIGAMVMLNTSLLNRIMVVEYALAAAIPAGLVAWHYVVQLSRPMWGHGSDRGERRTPWIAAGMAMLGLGTLLAVDSILFVATSWWLAAVLAVTGFALVGAGVGAAGTSLLALLASSVTPVRRPAAAATTWIMMVLGIVVAAGIAGSLLDPFSPRRLVAVATGVVLVAFVLAMLAVRGIEREAAPEARAPAADNFGDALSSLWEDLEARRFTIFVFVSMLAYSMQDMILEPFAGLMFAMTPGQTTHLSGIQHMGVLAGMILVGVGGGAFGGGSLRALRTWTIVGCVGSSVALAGLAVAAHNAQDWPLAANVALLGFANGVFAVSAIGSMMALAGAGGTRSEGIRMGVWGASQAIAFGSGGLIGALGVDLLRRFDGETGAAFATVFAFEGGLFLVAAWLAANAVAAARTARNVEALA